MIICCCCFEDQSDEANYQYQVLDDGPPVKSTSVTEPKVEPATDANEGNTQVEDKQSIDVKVELGAEDTDEKVKADEEIVAESKSAEEQDNKTAGGKENVEAVSEKVEVSHAVEEKVEVKEKSNEVIANDAVADQPKDIAATSLEGRFNKWEKDIEGINSSAPPVVSDAPGTDAVEVDITPIVGSLKLNNISRALVANAKKEEVKEAVETLEAKLGN